MATGAVTAAVTERSRTRVRRPSAALVVWSSIALFAALFTLLTYRLAASGQFGGAAERPVVVRKVVKRRVVTTIVPTPGPSTVSSGPVTSSYSTSGTAPLTTSTS